MAGRRRASGLARPAREQPQPGRRLPDREARPRDRARNHLGAPQGCHVEMLRRRRDA